MWISTDKGLTKFDIKTQEITNFDNSDGLQDNKFNDKTECRLKNGKMIFGGNNGLNIFHPDSIKQNKYIPPIVLEKYKNGNHIIDDLSNINNLDLQYNQNSFEFRFASLDYNHPIENKYKYKLKGFDKHWTFTTSKERKAKYTNISSGKYTFSVKGSKNANQWNEKGRSIHIVIHPPLWQTIPFIILYLLIFISILYFIYKVKVKKLMNYNKKLAKIVAVRTEKIRNQKEKLENKNFLISESISCAANIQKALLENKTKILEKFKNNFILFEPKDIVSGDFYWSYKHNDKSYIAVIDCTGHGVPGAFITLIGYTILEKIMQNNINITPSQILNKLNSEFIEMIHNNKPPQFPVETMDICLLQIDKKTKTITFSGAMRPLYLVKNNHLEVLEGTDFSIGDKLNINFDEHQLKIDTSHLLYLTTDGFSDQNNDKGEKFGLNELKKIIIKNSSLNIEKQKENLLTELSTFKKTEPLRDDITILGIKI